MNFTESYYIVYNETLRSYLTPLNSWSKLFNNAARIAYDERARELAKKHRVAGQDVRVMICQADVKLEML